MTSDGEYADEPTGQSVEADEQDDFLDDDGFAPVDDDELAALEAVEDGDFGDLAPIDDAEIEGLENQVEGAIDADDLSDMDDDDLGGFAPIDEDEVADLMGEGTAKPDMMIDPSLVDDDDVPPMQEDVLADDDIVAFNEEDMLEIDNSDIMNLGDEEDEVEQSQTIPATQIAVAPIAEDEGGLSGIDDDEIDDEYADTYQEETSQYEESNHGAVSQRSEEPVYEDIFGEGQSGQTHRATAGMERKRDGKNAFEETLESLKKKRRKKEIPPDAAQDKMMALVEKMHKAHALDKDALKRAKPALNKLSLLAYIEKFLEKAFWQDWFVTCNGCSALCDWLEPNPDLPNLTIREAVFRILKKLPISQEALRASKLGRRIRFYSKHRTETNENKRICAELIAKWLRSVFGQTTSAVRHRNDMQQMYEMQAETYVAPVKTQDQLAAEEAESNQRRHPRMFIKPDLNYKVQPRYQRVEAPTKADPMSTRGKLTRTLAAMRTPSTKSRITKHAVNSISGKEMNLTF